MTTNIIYQLSFKGWPIGTNGQINEDHTDIASFTSLEEIESFVALWKTLEETLMLIQQDNTIVKDLEQQLAAAEQGIELE